MSPAARRAQQQDGRTRTNEWVTLQINKSCHISAALRAHQQDAEQKSIHTHKRTHNKKRSTRWSCGPFTGWRIHIGCIIFVRQFLQKSPEISGSFAERDLQLGARQAEGLQPRSRRALPGLDQSPSNRTSPPNVRFQIGHLLPASCIDVRSEIGCLPKWDVRFEIGHWIKVWFQNGEMSDLKKSGKSKRERARKNPWETLVRPLWRAAGWGDKAPQLAAGDKAPQLAARPGILCIFTTL